MWTRGSPPSVRHRPRRRTPSCPGTSGSGRPARTTPGPRHWPSGRSGTTTRRRPRKTRGRRRRRSSARPVAEVVRLPRPVANEVLRLPLHRSFGDGGGALASDFGSSVSVYRSDSKPPQQADQARILGGARVLQSAGRDHIRPFAELELVIGSCQDEDRTEAVNLRLTSYFLEDDDNEVQQDAIIARDEVVARQFAQQLEQLLGKEYRVESYSGRW